MSDGSRFQWWVDDGGYRWGSGKEFNELTEKRGYTSSFRDDDRVIMSKKTTGQTLSAYDPMNKNPVLFREFISLSGTETDYLVFANRYGLLDYTIGLTDRRGFTGERFEDWTEAQERLSRVVELWDRAVAEDLDYLRTRVQWYTRKHRYGGEDLYFVECAGMTSGVHKFIDPGEQSHISLNPSKIKKYVPHIIEVCQPGDLVMPAKLFAAAQIDRYLDLQLRNRTVFDVERAMFVSSVTPRHLLAAMWLQFKESICTGQRSRRCEQCGLWFEQKRSTKKYCSETCRSRAFKARQANGNGHSAASE